MTSSPSTSRDSWPRSRHCSRIEGPLPPPDPSESHDAASQLRHDLVNPLGRILSYCDLLIEDAGPQGRAYRAQALRAIRNLGKDALEVIDRELLRRPEADMTTLARGVIGPCNAILRSCQALEEASSEVPDRDHFLEDLAKIRKDAELMIAIMNSVCIY